MKLMMKKLMIALLPFVIGTSIAAASAAGTVCDFFGGGAFGCIRTDGTAPGGGA